MIIEILGVGFINKGAELMLRAISTRLQREIPNVKIVLNCNSLSEWRAITAEGLYKKLNIRKKGIDFGDISNYIPAYFRSKHNIVLDRDIELVLDASGFAYGDVWGPKYAMQVSKSLKKWKRQGTKVVLLPQAFGPFKEHLNILQTKKMINEVDRVYVRDKISFEHVKSLKSSNPNIYLKPDFTMLLEGSYDDKYDRYKDSICIIPNSMVIRKSDNPSKMETRYIEIISNLITKLRLRNNNLFLLIHEGHRDFSIAQTIKEKYPEIDIIVEKDTLKIKQIIGNSKAVIGSRFHGLVSSLSQSIPSLAIGWSHKYEMLFSDFNYGEGILPIESSDELIDEKIRLITDAEKYTEIKKNLNRRSLLLKNEVEKMWDEIVQNFLTK